MAAPYIAAADLKSWHFPSDLEIADAGESVIGKRLANEGASLANIGRSQDNALGALQLDQATGEAGALSDFRDKMAAGDENALGALDPYPEIKAKMRAAIDQMSDADKAEAHKQAIRLAEAAMNVAKLPEGSVERDRRWAEELARLKQEGVVDDNDAKALANPSDEVLDQIFTSAETLDEAIADWKKSRTKESLSYDDLPLGDRLKIDEAIRKRAEAGLSDYDTAKPDEMKARLDAARDDVFRELELLPSSGDGTSAPAATVAPKGGSPSPSIGDAFGKQPMIVGPGGKRMVLSPDGKSWVPLQ